MGKKCLLSQYMKEDVFFFFFSQTYIELYIYSSNSINQSVSHYI